MRKRKFLNSELMELNLFNILFTVSILIVVVLFTTLSVKVEKLENGDFWTLNLIKVGGLIILFNWFRVSGIKIAKKKRSSYRKANYMHGKMCDSVKSKGLKNLVELRVKEHNQQALKDAQEDLLAKHTNIITLDEILNNTNKEVAHKCKEIGYGWYHRWKIIGIANKIKKGKVAYDKYTVHLVLHNPSSVYVRQSISDKGEGKILFYENIYISLRYLLFGAFLMLLDWQGDWRSIVMGLVVNLALALSASFSGSQSADDYVGRCTDRLNNKNDLLASVEGIDYSGIEEFANSQVLQEDMNSDNPVANYNTETKNLELTLDDGKKITVPIATLLTKQET